MANYTVQFADNRQYVVGATLPVLLKEGQYDAAQNCSPPSPPMKCLRSVMLSAWQPCNKAESLRLARLLYQQRPTNLPPWIS
ncbi:hypothetical protein ACULNC_08375 [Shigella flexneri]